MICAATPSPISTTKIDHIMAIETRLPIAVATESSTIIATRMPRPIPASSISQYTSTGRARIIARLTSIPITLKCTSVNGSTAPVKSRRIPATCIAQFQGSR